MGNGINQVLTATCTDEYEETAAEQLLDRALLYNRDKKDLNIVLNRKALPLTAVDHNNIIKNEKNQIALKSDIVVDSVTTRADHEGIDWKSQSKVGETSENNTVFLLFKQTKAEGDTTSSAMVSDTPAVVGGEILEVGNGILGHYQISLTSTGSRLLKGATTFDKKARLVLAKYNDEYYYGIKFKSGIPASIYFAGWQHVDDSIVAPAYTEYEDSDLSEIIELDDDSDTGTQVIDYQFLTYKDVTWEFASDITVDNSQAPNLNSDGYYDYGIVRIYPSNNNNATITQHPEWNSVLVEGRDITPWRVEVDQDNASIVFTCKNWNDVDTNIVLYGSDNDGNTDFSKRIPGGGYIAANPNIAHVTKEYRWDGLSKGIYWIRQGSGNYVTRIEYYPVTVEQEAITDKGNWTNNADNSGFDFGDGLKLITTNRTTWSAGPTYNNYGIIRVNGRTYTSEPLASLRVQGACTITVGASRPGSTASNLRITETLNTSDSLWNKSVSAQLSRTGITEVKYSYTGAAKDIYFINETGSIDWYYVKVDYPTLGGSEEAGIVGDVIQGLDPTGEDGSPHILRLNGTVTKATLLTIAANIRENSNTQIVVDLSSCTMESGYTDWTADADLTQLFIYCVGLRAFYYPHNVTTSGARTFMHCSFLREVHFNPEMEVLGQTTWNTDYIGVFAGSRIKTIFLPKSIRAFAGYTFSESNIINIYCERGSSLTSNYCIQDSWAEWAHTRKHTFYFPTPDYTTRSQVTAIYGQYANKNAGIDVYIQSNDLLRNNVKLWENYDVLENPEFEIDYTD